MHRNTAKIILLFLLWVVLVCQICQCCLWTYVAIHYGEYLEETGLPDSQETYMTYLTEGD